MATATTTTLESLAQELGLESAALVELLEQPCHRANALRKSSIQVRDWNFVEAGGRQNAVLFDVAFKRRYGFYSDNATVEVVALDKGYLTLKDWGKDWDDVPEVLAELAEDED